MSIKVMTVVWEYSAHKGSDLLLLLAIADHADDEGVAYPSIARLARKTRMTDRNVQHRLRLLKQSKELDIYLNAGPKRTHLFRIKIHGEKFSPLEDGKVKASTREGEKFSGVKTFQGEKTGSERVKPTSPESSEEPSSPENQDNSLSSFESLSGAGSEAASAPARQPSSSRKWGRRDAWEKTDEGWFYDLLITQEGLWQRSAFVLDLDWWHKLDTVYNLEEELLRREFNRMRAKFAAGYPRRTSAMGWKKFLTAWFEHEFQARARQAKSERMRYAP